MKMTTEEAFVKVLQMHGIEHAFGIIGSGFHSPAGLDRAPPRDPDRQVRPPRPPTAAGPGASGSMNLSRHHSGSEESSC
ncbi:hypothetical protein H4P12_12655 [Paracoccus sp. 11-3]|uniref:Thiamine pyrophosphate enzyme, N-terminal TPP binding domain n=1 Tax=Paracoccus amoyensis TaxID=2760093 RepID=A0A926J6S0_9RHOB|nr:hypothetical protein [Paracoccus amoyensis]MBC9247537.1 hypothetical protein [Paracoccus amoyensis]